MLWWRKYIWNKDDGSDGSNAAYTLPLFRTFAAVADQWLRARKPLFSAKHCYVKESTLRSFAFLIAALNQFFGEKTMEEIRACPDILAEYQIWRSAKAGPQKINQELNICIRILKAEGAWTQQHSLRYRRFRTVESDIPRALTPSDQALWLETARSQPQWDWVYWYTVLGLRTTASPWELRTLKLEHVNLHGGYIQVTSATAKTKYRVRSIPLTEDAFDAAHKLLTRARRLGADKPWHYLFPMHFGLHYDPTRYLSSVKWRWDEVRAASGLHNFRPYHLRHTAITRLAEAGTPIAVIMSMAGHLDRKMTEHYTWVGEHAKRRALEAAAGNRMYDETSLDAMS
jgi:integrase